MNKLVITIFSLTIILSGCASSTVVNDTTEASSDVASEVKATNNDTNNSEQFIWPEADPKITATIDAYEGHTGVDISNGKGTEVVAAASGQVAEAGFDQLGDGYYVLIDHPDSTQTKYTQMTENLQVTVGQQVEQGQVVGYEGDSGNSTGAHLHFEIIENGTPIDPESKLPSL